MKELLFPTDWIFNEAKCEDIPLEEVLAACIVFALNDGLGCAKSSSSTSKIICLTFGAFGATAGALTATGLEWNYHQIAHLPFHCTYLFNLAFALASSGSSIPLPSSILNWSCKFLTKIKSKNFIYNFDTITFSFWWFLLLGVLAHGIGGHWSGCPALLIRNSWSRNRVIGFN